uniref:Uncharacterized protein n=1 Tax=Zea mays TaxID=4577 RepID=C4J002_MAIZE|nr:unknown [Zea mays]
MKRREAPRRDEVCRVRSAVGRSGWEWETDRSLLPKFLGIRTPRWVSGTEGGQVVQIWQAGYACACLSGEEEGTDTDGATRRSE